MITALYLTHVCGFSFIVPGTDYNDFIELKNAIVKHTSNIIIISERSEVLHNISRVSTNLFIFAAYCECSLIYIFIYLFIYLRKKREQT